MLHATRIESCGWNQWGQPDWIVEPYPALPSYWLSQPRDKVLLPSASLSTVRSNSACCITYIDILLRVISTSTPYAPRPLCITPATNVPRLVQSCQSTYFAHEAYCFILRRDHVCSEKGFAGCEEQQAIANWAKEYIKASHLGFWMH